MRIKYLLIPMARAIILLKALHSAGKIVEGVWLVMVGKVLDYEAKRIYNQGRKEGEEEAWIEAWIEGWKKGWEEGWREGCQDSRRAASSRTFSIRFQQAVEGRRRQYGICHSEDCG